MREIKFRGKSLDDGKWVYGDLTTDTYDKNDYETGYAYCINDIPVEEETIGEYTGLYDTELVDIYEGDIIKFPAQSIPYSVEFREGAFVLGGNEWMSGHVLAPFAKVAVVIGNIHDNNLL